MRQAELLISGFGLISGFYAGAVSVGVMMALPALFSTL
jgi:hypothetical protein